MTRSTGLSVAVAMCVLALSGAALRESAADDQHKHAPHQHAAPPVHGHPMPPPVYQQVDIPTQIWTDEQALERGRTVYAANCAACHGERGAGDGPAATAPALTPPSFRDSAMFAEMTPGYLYWRVSEGNLSEPFAKAGSAMPPFKATLSEDDRKAVIAYVHSLSGHRRPHVAAEHPEMGVHAGHVINATAYKPHPAPRGVAFESQWVRRDHRRQPRGPWRWALERELPQLYREFNGIDFGHTHLAETLLKTQEPQALERARLDVLDFIFSSPSVPPDEEQVAPNFNRLVWELTKTFDWTHLFHRSLYDVFASDKVRDKDAAYRTLLADYLEKPEAITPHRLDHHNALWSFPESKAFRDRAPKFNTQIWAYHWLQAAVYDVQLLGDAAKQRELMPRAIAYYHGYLRRPPVEWRFMPMMPEAAPEFAQRFPEAAAIFDNLHMLHDNVDDVLARPDLYPTLQAKRAAILAILPIYLRRSHGAHDLYPEFHEQPSGDAGMDMGPRPPSAAEVLAGTAPPSDQPLTAPQTAPKTPDAGHKH
jgi:mono/diheme cytochrome c family protein